MAKKIKRRRRVVKVSCDTLAYEDDDGEEYFPRAGQWVEFKRKMSGDDFSLMWSFGELLESGKNEDLFPAIPAVLDFLAKKIVAWNWVDIDGESDDDGNFPSLPPPSREIIGDLDFDTDVVALVEALMRGVVETPKNESGPSSERPTKEQPTEREE